MRIGLGISDFRTLRAERAVYIDKSLLVRDLLNDGAAVVLLPRPRRFGKTTNLSMLRAFFERGFDEDKAARWGLFADLEIARCEEARAHFGRYPVIALSFKDIKTKRWDRCLAALRQVLARAFIEHRALLLRTDLDPEDLAAFDRVLRRTAEESELWDALRLLTQLLHQVHGQPVLLLLDEYDTPLHSAYLHGYYDEALEFLRNLLSAGLKDNPHLWKGVLTGVLRVARDSIFTGLNHLAVYGILQPEFSAFFGFSEDEVRALLPEGPVGEDQLAVIRSWYNGYNFGGRVVYNPWSVLSFVRSEDKRPRPFWAETSSNDLVRELLIDQGLGLSADLETLIAGGAIERELVDQFALREARDRSDLVWSLLLHTGYLKPQRLWLQERRLFGQLAIPNQEVLSIYEDLFRAWAEKALGGGDNRRALCAAVLRGDAERLQALVQTWMLSAVSFYDTASHSPPERFYHGFVLGLLVDLSATHRVESNRESGFGRCDVLVIPKKPGGPGVALELKVRDERRGETVESALAAAHRQLRERDYAAALREAGAAPLYQVALVFDGKTVHVTSD